MVTVPVPAFNGSYHSRSHQEIKKKSVRFRLSAIEIIENATLERWLASKRKLYIQIACQLPRGTSKVTAEATLAA